MRVVGRGSVMSDSCSCISPCVLGDSSPHHPANTGPVVKSDATHASVSRLITDARMPTGASPAFLCARSAVNPCFIITHICGSGTKSSCQCNDFSVDDALVEENPRVIKPPDVFT
ncbi:unnamed protein product [Leuciscus chuanchicus]